MDLGTTKTILNGITIARHRPTLSEVVEASTAARNELLPFVSTELPATRSLCDAFQFGLATFNLRFVFKLCPFLKRFLRPFTREMINLGGLEREDSKTLLRRLMGEGGVLENEELEEAALKTCEGNPWFLEEVMTRLSLSPSLSLFPLSLSLFPLSLSLFPLSLSFFLLSVCLSRLFACLN